MSLSCSQMPNQFGAPLHGAGEGDRTLDLLLGKQTHYRCATPASGELFCPALSEPSLEGKTQGCNDLHFHGLTSKKTVWSG